MSKVSCTNNKKRKVENYLFGSTCFIGPSPRYWNPAWNKFLMIPRPYKYYKPWMPVHEILNDEEFNDLIDLCANETKTY